MQDTVIDLEPTALARRESYAVAQPATVDEIIGQVTLIQTVMERVMKQDVHYGKIPGCGDRPVLLKPGAEKLMMTFRLAPSFAEEVVELPKSHREYRVKCTITSIGSGQLIGQGVGSCSTMESKFRYRTENTHNEVPKAYWDTRDSALLGGPTYQPKKVDGKWLIFHKVEHDNPADYYNTCLKMAKKRAHVDATITCTAASDIFQQDIEDLAENGVIGTDAPKVAPAPAKPKQAAPKPTVAVATAAINAGEKAPVSDIMGSKEKFLKTLAGEAKFGTWVYCVQQDLITEIEKLEEIAETRVPPISLVAAWLAENGDLAPEWRQKYQDVYNDGIPGAEHPSDPTPETEDYTPKIDRSGWKSLEIHYGVNRGVKLGDMDRKKLYGLWANFKAEPREWQGKMYDPSPADIGLRKALDEAGAHYNFTKRD